MNIRKLLLALVLLVFSPFVVADEMGTGASSTSSSDQNMTAPEPGTEPSGEAAEDAFWQMLLDWFE